MKVNIMVLRGKQDKPAAELINKIVLIKVS